MGQAGSKLDSSHGAACTSRFVVSDALNVNGIRQPCPLGSQWASGGGFGVCRGNCQVLISSFGGSGFMATVLEFRLEGVDLSAVCDCLSLPGRSV